MPGHCFVVEGESFKRVEKNMADGIPIIPSAQRLRTQGPASITTAGFVNPVVLAVSLLAQRRQRRLAVGLSGWAQNERAPVCGGNGLNACSDERTYHPYGQNRDPDCQLCIHLYHCLAP